jgi:ribA/ribD-fused uncharacterized protein
MIASFAGPYRFLSNFWPCKIVAKNGLTFRSTEAAYQAAKCRYPEEMASFTTLDAGASKKLGRTITIRPDWDDIKLTVMRRLVEQKFSPGTELAQKLLDTGDHELVEGNTWFDRFWGQCPLGVGENWLGKILMERRTQLRENS